MAGISTGDIKSRIRTMESTKQITKAMEMVASSKLRRAQNQLLASRPYFEILRSTVEVIAKGSRDVSSPYFAARPVRKALYAVIAGDRGLAGGYNSSIFKLTAAQAGDKDFAVLPIGRKAVEHFRSRREKSLTERYTDASSMDIEDCSSIAKLLSRLYLQGDFDAVFVCYTNFVSPISQIPTALQLLPLNCEAPEKHEPGVDYLYEPSREAVLEAVVPDYLGGVLFGCLCESRASEQAARRTAMESASSNAEELIVGLRLTFNRARQAAITQEITEIVAGS